MADMTVPLAHRVADNRQPRASKRLGLVATLGWGAAGLAATMIFWLTAQLPDALAWLRLEHPLLVLVSFGHVLAAAVVVAALWVHGLPFREHLALPPLRGRDIGRGIGYGLAGYGVLLAAYILIPLVQSALGIGSGAPLLTRPPIDGAALTLVSLWISMVIAAPIAEELLFRGFLYRGLAESRLGAFAAIVITSLAFGLLHYPGFGWTRVAGTACVGFLFGWLRWRTGNTGIGIVAHAMMNLIGAAILTAIILAS